MPSYACEIYEQISSSEAFFCRPVSSWIPSAIHSFRTPSLNGLFKDTSSDWRREVRVWRKCSQYLSCELQMSRKQASSFSSPGHRSVHFYFLCCVFNVCKLGRAWQTIESVYNTHRDFDACFYGKKSAHYTRVNTVNWVTRRKGKEVWDRSHEPPQAHATLSKPLSPIFGLRYYRASITIWTP